MRPPSHSMPTTRSMNQACQVTNPITNTSPRPAGRRILSDSNLAKMADPNTNQSSYSSRFSFEDDVDIENRFTLPPSKTNPSFFQQNLKASPAPPQLSLGRSTSKNNVGSTETFMTAPVGDTECQVNASEEDDPHQGDNKVTAQQLSVSSEQFEDLMPDFLKVDDEMRQALSNDARPKTSNEILRLSLDSFCHAVGISNHDRKQVLEESEDAIVDEESVGRNGHLAPPSTPVRSARLSMDCSSLESVELERLFSVNVDSLFKKLAANQTRRKKSVRFQLSRSTDKGARVKKEQLAKEQPALPETTSRELLSSSDCSLPDVAERLPGAGIFGREMSNTPRTDTNPKKARKLDGESVWWLFCPMTDLDKCEFDNLYHEHNHTVDKEYSVVRCVGLNHNNLTCKCFSSKYGFRINSCALTHGEGKLYPNIANPLCMICSDRIINVCERTFTHLKSHDILLESSEPGKREEATEMKLTAKQICGQNFHIDCLAKMIQKDLLEGRQPMCPSCKTPLPVQPDSMLQKVGKSIGRLFSPLTSLMK